MDMTGSESARSLLFVTGYFHFLCQGALWHIYSRSDASKIRSFLRKVSQPVQYSHTTSTI